MWIYVGDILYKLNHFVHLLVCARYRELYHGVVCKGIETSNITITFKLLDNAGRGYCDGHESEKACCDLKFNTTKMMKAALNRKFEFKSQCDYYIVIIEEESAFQGLDNTVSLKVVV